ncbi:ABC transporter permease [Paenibacillus eucommiae]|uniref:Aldouronate transport system permease protein n=1 Tax=Paenibacillus eucommiae TaxID=1355755 RepID=A0ABS4IPC2_9BACL|nr:ABC transporter permease subunit [Paenibacillus eucommiae]MBP1989404.1 putative aldouronate transport system permease protein [Paenibacillus eucommiae]
MNEMPHAVQSNRLNLKKKNSFSAYWKYKYLTLIFLPAIIYYVIFHYVPIYGVLIAFKSYKFSLGILGSPWVGFQHFRDLFAFDSFWQVFRNTFLISIYKLIFGFPAPIVFALLLNEIRLSIFKRLVQTISYFPHFLSWVVLGGLAVQFLSPSIGPINLLLQAIGLDPIYFLGDSKWFRTVLVGTEVWKGLGWGTIVYLAAIAGVNPELHEAATVDGANRFHRMRYITLPSMMPVITIMLIFAIGGMVNDDFDQVFNLYNPVVYEVGDVLSTYTYRMGLINMEYSFATAVGLFKNVIAFVLILSANAIAKKINDYGLW